MSGVVDQVNRVWWLRFATHIHSAPPSTALAAMFSRTLSSASLIARQYTKRVLVVAINTTSNSNINGSSSSSSSTTLALYQVQQRPASSSSSRNNRNKDEATRERARRMSEELRAKTKANDSSTLSLKSLLDSTHEKHWRKWPRSWLAGSLCALFGAMACSSLTNGIHVHQLQAHRMLFATHTCYLLVFACACGVGGGGALLLRQRNLSSMPKNEPRPVGTHCSLSVEPMV
jgi:hypothetical protein